MSLDFTPDKIAAGIVDRDPASILQSNPSEVLTEALTSAGWFLKGWSVRPNKDLCLQGRKCQPFGVSDPVDKGERVN